MTRISPPLLALCLLLAACGDPDGIAEAPGTTASAGSGTVAALPSVDVGTTRAMELRAVLDGDSLEVDLDGRVEEVRMLGINTPERSECWSAEARNATKDLVEDSELSVADRGRDQYGRILGYVLADGELVNLRLLADGQAAAIAADHDLLSEFLDMEEAAFGAGLGIWAADACGPPAPADIRIDEVVADPRGPDDDPRDGEFIRLRNEGSATADLSGWTIRDESSVHRYPFPNGTELEPGDTVTVRSVCGVDEHCFGPDTVWSNGGDTVLLLDPNGNVVDRIRYQGD